MSRQLFVFNRFTLFAVMEHRKGWNTFANSANEKMEFIYPCNLLRDSRFQNNTTASP